MARLFHKDGIEPLADAFEHEGSLIAVIVSPLDCAECQGTGVLEVDMQFMAPVTVTCDACNGHRFRPSVLAVRCRGLNIAETLELTVEEALTRFADQQRLCRRLQSLVDVGLGYLTLDRQSRTLSGGEVQRVALTSALGSSLVNAAAGDALCVLLLEKRGYSKDEFGLTHPSGAVGKRLAEEQK